jgi:hypothetical protein
MNHGWTADPLLPAVAPPYLADKHRNGDEDGLVSSHGIVLFVADQPGQACRVVTQGEANPVFLSYGSLELNRSGEHNGVRTLSRRR